MWAGTLRTFLFATLVFVSGCTSPSEDSNPFQSVPAGTTSISAVQVPGNWNDTVAKLPGEWNNTAPLLPSNLLSGHSGWRGAELQPNGTVVRPTSCLAYRDDRSMARDSCGVRDAKYNWESHAEWVLEAFWAGCPGGDWNGCHEQTYPAPYRCRVVAFDAQGHPLAWWDGAVGPHTMHTTE